MPFDGFGGGIRYAVLDVLTKSREYLADRKHWVKGAERSEGQVCIFGAIKMYSEDYPEPERPQIIALAMGAVSNVIASLYSIRSQKRKGKDLDEVTRVTSFNDHVEIPHAHIGIVLENAVENVVQRELV